MKLNYSVSTQSGMYKNTKDKSLKDCTILTVHDSEKGYLNPVAVLEYSHIRYDLRRFYMPARKDDTELVHSAMTYILENQSSEKDCIIITNSEIDSLQEEAIKKLLGDLEEIFSEIIKDNDGFDIFWYLKDKDYEYIKNNPEITFGKTYKFMDNYNGYKVIRIYSQD